MLCFDDVDLDKVRGRTRQVVVALERQGSQAAADPEKSNDIEYPSKDGVFCGLGRLQEVR